MIPITDKMQIEQGVQLERLQWEQEQLTRKIDRLERQIDNRHDRLEDRLNSLMLTGWFGLLFLLLITILTKK